MTPEQKQRARELLDAATPGPWSVEAGRDADGDPEIGILGGGARPNHVVVPHWLLDEKDAALIAAAPDLLAAALDEIERLEIALLRAGKGTGVWAWSKRIAALEAALRVARDTFDWLQERSTGRQHENANRAIDAIDAALGRSDSDKEAP